MKRFLKLTNLFALATLLMVFSCDNEPLDGDFAVGSGSGSNNTGNETTQPSTGDYWPMAIGNNWSYNNELDGQPQQDSEMNIDDLVSYDGEQ